GTPGKGGVDGRQISTGLVIRLGRLVVIDVPASTGQRLVLLPECGEEGENGGGVGGGDELAPRLLSGQRVVLIQPKRPMPATSQVAPTAHLSDHRVAAQEAVAPNLRQAEGVRPPFTGRKA